MFVNMEQYGYRWAIYTVSVPVQCRQGCLYINMKHRWVMISIASTLYLQRLWLCNCYNINSVDMALQNSYYFLIFYTQGDNSTIEVVAHAYFKIMLYSRSPHDNNILLNATVFLQFYQFITIHADTDT